MRQSEWDPILAFAHGDRLRAQGLRQNLETIREHATDPYVRGIVDDVLLGRSSVRELVRNPAFERELDRGMAAFGDAWEQLSAEQRAELVRRGQQDAAARRAEMGLPPGEERPAQVGDSPLLRTEV